jgi:hypothetical protein
MHETSGILAVHTWTKQVQSFLKEPSAEQSWGIAQYEQKAAKKGHYQGTVI